MSASARTHPSRLGDIVGPENVVLDPDRLEAYQVDGVRPWAAVRPGSAEEVADVLRLAAAENLALIPSGARTKLGLGMPPRRYDVALDLARLDRLVAYDPGDLTLSVEAGCRLACLEAVLAEHNQFLPLVTPYYEQATIGGILATNADTPLRQFYGTARDYVLGMEFVTGEGVKAKSGGRVVKNVAGYDLHKLMIGALGTLGVITLANFKTFPRPHARRTYLASFPTAAEALKLRRQIVPSPLPLHALEILSPEMTPILEGGAWIPPARWTVAAEAAGQEPVLERCQEELSRMARVCGATEFSVPDEEQEHEFWRRIREFPARVSRASADAVLFKIGAPPARLEPIVPAAQQIAAKAGLPSAAVIRAVGILYFSLLPGIRGEASLAQIASVCRAIREMCEAAGGRAVVQSCPTELKRTVNVWGAPREDFPLMQKLKNIFDPREILSPGRFVGGL